MTDKTVSRTDYVWGHIAIIIFHIVVASLLISIYFMEEWSRNTVNIICVTLGSIMLTMSLLAFVPILNIREKIIIPS